MVERAFIRLRVNDLPSGFCREWRGGHRKWEKHSWARGWPRKRNIDEYLRVNRMRTKMVVGFKKTVYESGICYI